MYICCGSKGCGLRKIIRSPKVPIHEILGAHALQHVYERLWFTTKFSAILIGLIDHVTR